MKAKRLYIHIDKRQNYPTKRKKPRNEFQMLQDEIEQMKKDGVLENLSQSAYDRLMQNIRGRLNSYLQKQYRKSTSWYSTEFKRHFRKAKKDVTERAFGLKTFRIEDLNPKFSDAYKKALAYSLSLIKTRSEEDMLKLQNRFYNWITLPQVRDKESLHKLTKLPSDKKTKLLLRDQSNKLSGSLDRITAEHFKAICFQWKTRRDNRVAGDPSGKYPNADDNSTTHGNHYARRDKFWYFKDTPKYILDQLNLAKFEGKAEDIPDGLPSEPINCRCWMKTFYRVEDLPSELVKWRD